MDPDSSQNVTDPDSAPALFVSGFQGANKKISYFTKFFFAYYLLSVHLQKSLKIPIKLLGSHKTVEVKDFLHFLACSSWKDPDPGGPKTYGSGTLVVFLLLITAC